MDDQSLEFEFGNELIILNFKSNCEIIIFEWSKFYNIG